MRNRIVLEQHTITATYNHLQEFVYRTMMRQQNYLLIHGLYAVWYEKYIIKGKFKKSRVQIKLINNIMKQLNLQPKQLEADMYI